MESYLEAAKGLARRWDEARPRTRQTEIGWSGMADCRAYLGYQLAGAWPTDEPDKWRAIAGTALHTWWTHLRKAECARLGIPASFDVAVSYGGVKGHVDEVLWPTEPGGRFEVTDYKFPTLSSIRLWDDEEFLDELMVQPHGYAAGILELDRIPVDVVAPMEARYPVISDLDPDACVVRLHGMPVNAKSMDDWACHEQPFSRQVADDALLRLDQVRVAHENGIPLGAPELRDKPAFFCSSWCLTGETEVVTRLGIQPIEQLAGAEHQLLVPAKGGAVWLPCKVESYGIQGRIREIRLRRGRSTKTVHATADHLWMLQGPYKHQDRDGGTRRTADLTPGDRLRVIKRRHAPLAEVPFAVAQGFVYGDGCTPAGTQVAASLDLYDASAKPKALLPYFSCCDISRCEDPVHGTGWHVAMLPRSWRSAPDLSESPSFLLSWLAGYIAADGSVSKEGQLTISSADRASIELVRSICAIVGVGYRPVTTQRRAGDVTVIGRRNVSLTDLYLVSIDARDLPEWVLKLDHHRARTAKRREQARQYRAWVVESVQVTGRLEAVFCAKVSGHDHGFALADELLTHNCEFYTACRGGEEPKELELITDPEQRAAINAYGLAGELISANKKVQAELREMLEDARGRTEDGFRIWHGRGNPGKLEFDDAAVEAVLGARGIPVSEVQRHTPPGRPKLYVKRS